MNILMWYKLNYFDQSHRLLWSLGFTESLIHFKLRHFSVGSNCWDIKETSLQRNVNKNDAYPKQLIKFFVTLFPLIR